MTTPTNQFLPYAPEGVAGTDVMADAAYAASSQRVAGHQPGPADRALLNKALRQATAMTAALGDLAAAATGENILDDGQQSVLAEQLRKTVAAAAVSAGGGLPGGLASLDIVTTGGPEPSIGRMVATPTAVQVVAAGDAQELQLIGDRVRLPNAEDVYLGGGNGTIAQALASAGPNPDELASATLNGSERVAIKQAGSWFRTPVQAIASWLHITGSPDSVAALRLNAAPWLKVVRTAGYYTPRDGGGAEYVKDIADISTADDGFLCIVDAGGVRWKLSQDGVVSLRQAGARGDGVTNDAAAISKFVAHLLASGRSGYVPRGNYLHIGRLLVDMSASAVRSAPRIYGDGPYQSVIILQGSESNMLHFYSSGGNGFDHFFLSLTGIGFQGDTPLNFAAFGLNNFSDAPGNYALKDVFFGNANTTSSDSACTLELNFLFRSSFDNVVAAGRNWRGVATRIRRAVYCTFTGLASANANIGVSFEGTQPIVANDFFGLDVENCEYGVRNQNPVAFGNQFIGGYYDLVNPDTATNSTKHAFSSTVGQAGAINILGSPFVSRGGHISPTEQVGITLRGNIGPVVEHFSPSVPATGVGVRNTSGRVQHVIIWGGTVTSISINDAWDSTRDAFFYPIGAESTAYPVPPGAEVIVNYSAAPSWFWVAA